MEALYKTTTFTFSIPLCYAPSTNYARTCNAALSDLLPVTFPDARVTDDVEQGLVRLELLHMTAHAVGHVARRRLVRERFAQLVHGPTHLSELLLDSIGTQLLERACNTAQSSHRICISIVVVPMCYHTNFRRCRSNRFGLVRGSQKLGGGRWGPAPFDFDVAVPREICFSPTCVYRTKFGHSRSNRTSVSMEICQKISTVQGHSRSLEPTRIDRLPMTSY